MDFERVVKTYNQCESVRETALRHNISTGKVRKILVTCGAFDSGFYREVTRLMESGKTVKEIASILNRSEHCIYSYIPYTRGERTGESQTINAIRIRKCRRRKREEKNE